MSTPTPSPAPEPAAMPTEAVSHSLYRTSTVVISTIIVASVTLGLGYWLGYHDNNGSERPLTEIRALEGSYQYINPLLDYQNNSTALLRGDIKNLKEDLEALASEHKGDGRLTNVSLYYRDLNNGPWFSVNEDFKYTPASLLKIPIMIAYFKLSEEDSTLLTKKSPTTKKLPVYLPIA